MKFSHIETDDKLRSVLQYGTPDFPLLVFDDDFAYYRHNSINWHWHNQIEFAVTIRGEVDYYVANQHIRLAEGEGIFINANTLHMGKPAPNTTQALMFAVAFSTNLLATAGQSIIYNKYIMPIISDQALKNLRFSPDIPWQKNILDHLTTVYGLDQVRPFGYELMIHNSLSQAWNELLLSYTETFINVQKTDILDQKRLKTMTIYIQAHFDEHISLQDIADSANISKSTCYRCFQDCLNVAPLEYLKEYRLEKAMQLLMHDDLAVGEIGSRCGFDSNSYFIKTFKAKTGKTPLEYRNLK